MSTIAIESFNGLTSFRTDGSVWPFIQIAADNPVVADHNGVLANACDADYRTLT